MQDNGGDDGSKLTNPDPKELGSTLQAIDIPEARFP